MNTFSVKYHLRRFTDAAGLLQKVERLISKNSWAVYRLHFDCKPWELNLRRIATVLIVDGSTINIYGQFFRRRSSCPSGELKGAKFIITCGYNRRELVEWCRETKRAVIGSKNEVKLNWETTTGWQQHVLLRYRYCTYTTCTCKEFLNMHPPCSVLRAPCFSRRRSWGYVSNSNQLIFRYAIVHLRDFWGNRIFSSVS